MLKREKLVASPALHSFKSSTIDEIFVTREVNGAAIDASACDSDKPMSACLRAPLSLAPSPHIETIFPKISWYKPIILALSLGLAREKIFTSVMSWEKWWKSSSPYLQIRLKELPVKQSWALDTSRATSIYDKFLHLNYWFWIVSSCENFSRVKHCIWSE